MLSAAQGSGWPAGFVLVGIVAVSLLIMLVLISRSIADLRRVALRFAQGDLSQRVPLRVPWPLHRLASALNQMARQLDSRLQAVVQQRNEIEAILSSMVEGVLAIDQDERLISLNRAAAELLSLDPGQVLGRSIQEAVRNHALQLFVSETLRGDVTRQTEITLGRSASDTTANGERFVQAQGAALRDGAGRRIGAVIVLHDVTRLRRLETVRRDFVANVSHEVKTPVSAIKAAIETLLDDPAQPRDQAEHFMRMVQRQADRLNAIVDDLLSLARIEQEQQRVRLELASGSVGETIRAAVDAIRHKADAKSLSIEVTGDPHVLARLNRTLLEQAVVNLLDNAIKYSPKSGRITVAAQRRGDEVVIEVIDRGIGIEPEHLPRLFERFYRTDRARSRAVGGTGLGLAIVKHVVQAHGGRVHVESTPGQGSTFSIHLQPAHAEG